MKKLLALTPILAWLLVPAVSPGVSAAASETFSADILTAEACGTAAVAAKCSAYLIRGPSKCAFRRLVAVRGEDGSVEVFCDYGPKCGMYPFPMTP